MYHGLKRMDPLPAEMLGSKGQIIYPYGEGRTHEDPMQLVDSPDVRDMRDPERLYLDMKAKREIAKSFAVRINAHNNGK